MPRYPKWPITSTTVQAKASSEKALHGADVKQRPPGQPSPTSSSLRDHTGKPAWGGPPPEDPVEAADGRWQPGAKGLPGLQGS